jgi:hypothetical protein
MQAHPAVRIVPVHDAEVGCEGEARFRGGTRREVNPVIGHRRNRRVVMIRARRLVFIGERVPVPPEAHHADVHLTAAAHGRHVTAGGSIHDRAALIDECALLVDAQPVLEPDCAIGNRDELMLPTNKRHLRLHRCYMIFGNIELPNSNLQAADFLEG